jgi:hypothetical protein
MLAFLTTLRHPENSTDYLRVESLLQRTVASITRQQHPGYRLIIVGNRRPAFALPDAATFVQVNFSAPSSLRSPTTDRSSALVDKGTKLAIAAIAGLESGATHFMTADADDYFSRQIAGFVNDRIGAPGWYVANGYQYSERSRLIRRIDGRFHTLCGSSLIYRADLLGVPPIPAHSTQQQVLAEFGADKVLTLLGSHLHMKPHCEALGQPLQPLPFRGAVYNVSTSENHSGNTFDRLGRPVPRSLADEFGLRPGGYREALRSTTGVATVPATRAWRLASKVGSPRR